MWGYSKNGRNNPYMLSCYIPLDMEGKIPYKVTVAEEGAEEMVTNELPISYDIPPPGKGKENFAVCMKGKINEEHNARGLLFYLA